MLALIWGGIAVFSDFRWDDDNRWRVVGVCAFGSAPGIAVASTLLPGCGCFAFTVELEEDVDDSLTGGKALLEASFGLVLAALIICLGRSRLFEEYF
jgi:hypothetical protein